MFQAFIEVGESRTVGRVLEVVVDLVNVAQVVTRKPLVDIIAVDLLNVFVDTVASAVDNRAHELLHRKLQAHLLIEPVRSAFLQRAAVASFGVVEIYFLTALEFAIRIEVEPVGVAVARIAVRAAPDKGAAAIADPNVVEDLAVVVNECAIHQFVREIRSRSKCADNIVREPDTVRGKPGVHGCVAYPHKARSLRHFRRGLRLGRESS